MRRCRRRPVGLLSAAGFYDGPIYGQALSLSGSEWKGSFHTVSRPREIVPTNFAREIGQAMAVADMR